MPDARAENLNSFIFSEIGTDSTPAYAISRPDDKEYLVILRGRGGRPQQFLKVHMIGRGFCSQEEFIELITRFADEILVETNSVYFFIKDPCEFKDYAGKAIIYDKKFGTTRFMDPSEVLDPEITYGEI